MAALGVKTASIETPIGQLSGGNQQKAIIARWLATHPRVLILDEPTRGIDVAAKQELMNEILELARGGTAVLFISAEIEEVVRVSDRIMVLRDRAKAGELPRGADEDAVYSMIAATPQVAMKRLTQHALFWPAVTLALLLVASSLFNPSFLALAWRDGHLYGSLIDILNRAAPLMVVSLGMTLVIAVRGLDISVGAVVAIAAAVAALMIGGSFSATRRSAQQLSAVAGAVGTALAVAAACGLWNGLLVVKAGMQPIVATLILMVAGRGIAQLLTGGQIITVYYPPFFTLGNGFLLGLPVALWIAGGLWRALHLVLSRTALGLFMRAIGGNPGSGARGRRALLRHHAVRVHLLRPRGGRRRVSSSAPT